MSFKQIFFRIWLSILAVEIILVLLTFLGFSYLNSQQIRVLQSQNLDHIFEIEKSTLVGNLLIKNDRVLSEQLERIAAANKIRIKFEGLGYEYSKSGIDRKGEEVAKQYPLSYAGDLLGSLSLSAPISHGALPDLPILLVVLFGQILVAVFAIMLFSRYSKRVLADPVDNLMASIASNISAASSLPSETPLEFKHLAVTLDEIRQQLKKEQDLRIEQDRQVALGNLAAQVSHDIRSPLAALGAMEKDLYELSEERRIIIRSAVNRIRDIANNLLESNRVRGRAVNDNNSDKVVGIHLVSALLDQILTEKRLQYRSKIDLEIYGHFDDTSYGVFANIQTVEFKRVVSNLINNAVEATDGLGRIDLSLLATSAMLRITIKDEGRGIPKEIIPILTQRGATYDKKNGSGLGLYHARKCVESWGGKLIIESKESVGTEVILELPRAKAPSWFVPSLELKSFSAVAILDDDASIHQVWRKRIEAASSSDVRFELFHLSTPSDLRAFVVSRKKKSFSAIYLIDYELLGYPETGLDLIEELDISRQSILVSSRFEEPELRERCENLKIRLIPKGLAGCVPIVSAEVGDEAEVIPIGLRP